MIIFILIPIIDLFQSSELLKQTLSNSKLIDKLKKYSLIKSKKIKILSAPKRVTSILLFVFWIVDANLISVKKKTKQSNLQFV